MSRIFRSLLLLVALSATTFAVQAQNTLVPEGVSRYHATAFPDRVILIPTAKPESSQTINWRTNTEVTEAVAEIAVATDDPGLHLNARSQRGQIRFLKTENGPAHHHHVTFSQLEPDTLYAYRVMGQDTWSEWFQFRTAKAGFAEHTAIYFGDAQNSVKSLFSRVIREAFSSAPRAQVMIHAGDMVNSRDGRDDDEWGEWFEAGGFINSMINNVVAVGNHEYHRNPEGGPRILVPQVPVQFGTPNNGPAPLQDTVYFTDYQGVRYIALDSQQALQDLEMIELQTAWLKQILQDNPSRWTVVTYHHPMFSVSQGRDNPRLREYWLPVFEEYGVDLVLQGHDHTYGRGQNVPTGASGQLSDHGPMYVVSVAGPKMYRIADQAMATMDRLAEDTQLFQLINFEADRIRYEARTATGSLYDAFDIVRHADGRREVINREAELDPRLCDNPDATDRRCWGGGDFSTD